MRIIFQRLTAAYMACRGTKNANSARKNAVTKTINPKLVLKAAQLAIPEAEWTIVDGRVRVVNWFGSVGSRNLNPYWFDPLTSDADAFLLERALKQRGNGWWSFFVNALGLYMASSAEGPCESQYDESDTLLLLKCVSAQFSIPLYLENT